MTVPPSYKLLQRVAKVGTYNTAASIVAAIQGYFMEANLPIHIRDLDDFLRTELTSMESIQLEKTKGSLKDELGVDIPSEWMFA